MNDIMTGFKGVFKSRKAFLVMVLVGVLTVLLVLHKIDEKMYQELLQYIIPMWLGAHAVEEGAKHIGNGKTSDVPDPATMVKIVQTMQSMADKMKDEPLTKTAEEDEDEDPPKSTKD